MTIIITLAIFGLVTFLVVALIRSFKNSDIYEQRLLQLQGENNSPSQSPGTAKSGIIANIISSVARLFAARALAEQVQVQLIRAGIMLKGEEYIAICLMWLIIIPLLVMLLTHNIWLALGLLLIGAFIPRVYLNNRKEKRMATLNQQLGDTLVTMANSLRAGFGFQQAMDTVRREMPAPISEEFNWTLREMNLGFSQEEALLNMGKRINSDDLNMVITAILIQRQVGGNLAEILDNISNTIRDRAQLKRQIKTLTAQGRLSGIIIGLLPVCLILVMMAINPSYIGLLFKDPRGIGLLIFAGIMMSIGVMLITKIVKIEI
ncbi:MAG TPA: type II secretion system F family protein [Syntrophomonadaceae bacterium]|nr:type II secretion system F family protein [Syntrophomonadaceae bacterium]